MDDTIVAIATPLGEGGLGVVRLSGPQAFSISDCFFQSTSKLQLAKSHTLHHGWIFENQQRVDEAVAACFRNPTSYTGEDIVEISCHGSPVVLRTVVRLSQQFGARTARPGEFTQRAFLNGKIDLLQAEAVAELIHAKSEKARLAASEQLRGAFSEQIRDIRQPLVELLAHLEAHLDFVEDEIPGINWSEIASKIQSAEKKVETLTEMGIQGRWMRDGFRIALAGQPNVGKSSLFNALLSLDRAIVTEVPGTTRDTLEERVEWDGCPFVLVDTAGLRDTTDIIEVMGTHRARTAHQLADVILFVIDGSSALVDQEKKLLEEFKNKNMVVALNKSDKGRCLTPSQFAGPAVSVSAQQQTGLAELKSLLVQKSMQGSMETESRFIANERHVRHLANCQSHLQSILSGLNNRAQIEAKALDLREAIRELSNITGENTNEDVMNAIFQQFCIGK